MRTKADALRSLQKYVAELLAPNPRLYELQAGTGGGQVRWTYASRVVGARNVPVGVFEWLKRRDRHPPVYVGSITDPSTYYMRSVLVEAVADIETAAADEGVDLTGDTVLEWNLDNQPPWEVRLWYDRGEVPEDRPYARVHYAGGASTNGPALYFDVSQPFAVECYPVPGETAKESTMRCAAVEDVLLWGFRGAGVGLGRPLRIPLWDFDGVPETETATERNPSDYMKVLDFGSRQLPDTEDGRVVRVIADVRLSWRRDVDLTELKRRDGGPTKGTRIVQSVDWEMTGT